MKLLLPVNLIKYKRSDPLAVPDKKGRRKQEAAEATLPSDVQVALELERRLIKPRPKKPLHPSN